MKYLKYYFTPTQKANAFAKITTTDAEGNTAWDSSKVLAVVDLGQPILTPAVYDEEGNITTEAVLDTKHEVDILWADQPDSTMNANIVWPTPSGHHILAGWEQTYAKDFCEANPDHPYCQIPEPIEE